mmetsp:Transcript_5939/g.17341  ORF Transcript_5939/g.17341 Transcript_5939/m.17341 type:complete len:388 (-) Transcript_5939:112-1275(-)
MTEFWVSQAKHYCKYCKVWMQGDKMSIRKHETGKRHLEMLDEFKRTKREERMGSVKDDAELRKQLREIERAAAASLEQDLAAGSINYNDASLAAVRQGLGRSAPPPPDRRPPPPPPRPRSDTDGFGTALKKDGEEGGGEDEEEEEDKGIYTIKDVTYLDGKKHEDKLNTDAPCQIWLEDLEEWMDAIITSVKEISVPNTDLKIRTFSVAYYTAEQLSSSSTEPSVLKGLSSDKLRLIAKDSNGTWEDPLAEPAPVVDENTGLGGWETVAVREIDEEEEARLEEERQLKAEQEERMREERRKKRLALEEKDQADVEDAMSSYDPWGKGVYKGIDLTSEATTGWKYEEIDTGKADQGGEPVAFKKRKFNQDKGKKKKQFRKKTSDEDDE